MDSQTFQTIVEQRLLRIEKVLGAKAGEYAMGGDRLHNFKAAAKLTETTPRKALWGIAAKHLVSVSDLVNGELANTDAMATEKIGDLINYLILLEALLHEERQKEVR